MYTSNKVLFRGIRTICELKPKKMVRTMSQGEMKEKCANPKSFSRMTPVASRQLMLRSCPPFLLRRQLHMCTLPDEINVYKRTYSLDIQLNYSISNTYH